MTHNTSIAGNSHKYVCLMHSCQIGHSYCRLLLPFKNKYVVLVCCYSIIAFCMTIILILLYPPTDNIQYPRNHCFTANCSKIRADPSFISALRCNSSSQLSKIFSTKTKTSQLLPKLLVYVIRQGI